VGGDALLLATTAQQQQQQATGNHATDSRQLPVLEAVWQLLAMAMAVVAMAVHVM
jgi:hypothetical protein